MAKTFDTIYEAQEVNYMSLFVRLVWECKDARAAPPTLNLLSLPYRAAKGVYASEGVYALWKRKRALRKVEPSKSDGEDEGDAQAEKAGGKSDSKAEPDKLSAKLEELMKDAAKHAKQNAGMEEEDAKETGEPAMRTQNVNVEKEGRDILAEEVAEYIVENIDDVEQESHWRAKFGKKVSDISKQLKDLKEDNKELKQDNKELKQDNKELKEDIARRHKEMMKLLMELKTASTA
jgi:hypothetical protein